MDYFRCFILQKRAIIKGKKSQKVKLCNVPEVSKIAIVIRLQSYQDVNDSKVPVFYSQPQFF